ncbi:MAG: L,D-transpeptidase family protein [Solirubrobacteraceae bacterium]
MRSRSFIAVIVLLVVLLGGAVGVYAYDQGHREEIAKGVRVGGVNVGGLHPDQARARLRHHFLRELKRVVDVRYHGQRFVLTSRQAKLAADLDATVDEALARSRSGSIFTRVSRRLSGGRVDANLEPRVSYSRAAVSNLTARVAKSIGHPAKDASISFSGSGLNTVPSRPGVTVDRGRLRARIERALLNREGIRRVRVPTETVQAKITSNRVASKYPTVVTIDRAGFRLHLFKHLKLVKSYPIAVGRQGLETPTGLYPVNDRQVNPVWHVPNSSWAGKLAGKTIPPGPKDPIKARWIGITGGAGIHGTTETGSLGSAASHGCIRMAIPDVIELFPRVPYGSMIYVA